jgi:hypothetical protein
VPPSLHVQHRALVHTPDYGPGPAFGQGHDDMLIAAARQGDLATVKKLLKQSSSVKTATDEVSQRPHDPQCRRIHYPPTPPLGVVRETASWPHDSSHPLLADTLLCRWPAGASQFWDAHLHRTVSNPTSLVLGP